MTLKLQFDPNRPYHLDVVEDVVYVETERAIVHGNRESIRLYEEKVKKVIERVWEG
jgi:hypothetical protein